MRGKGGRQDELPLPCRCRRGDRFVPAASPAGREPCIVPARGRASGWDRADGGVGRRPRGVSARRVAAGRTARVAAHGRDRDAPRGRVAAGDRAGAAPPRDQDDRPLREGRPQGAARARAAMAGRGCGMTSAARSARWTICGSAVDPTSEPPTRPSSASRVRRKIKCRQRTVALYMEQPTSIIESQTGQVEREELSRPTRQRLLLGQAVQHAGIADGPASAVSQDAVRLQAQQDPRGSHRPDCRCRCQAAVRSIRPRLRRSERTPSRASRQPHSAGSGAAPCLRVCWLRPRSANGEIAASKAEQELERHPGLLHVWNGTSHLAATRPGSDESSVPVPEPAVVRWPTRCVETARLHQKGRRQAVLAWPVSRGCSSESIVTPLVRVLDSIRPQVSGLFGEGLERWCGAWDLLLGWATGGNWQVLGGDHFAAEA